MGSLFIPHKTFKHKLKVVKKYSLKKTQHCDKRTSESILTLNLKVSNSFHCPAKTILLYGCNLQKSFNAKN